jgi:hypothetical protein
MPRKRLPHKLVIATAIVGVGVLGIGAAGAVGGIPISPGPDSHAGSHPAPEATEVTLPEAASAGSSNAASPPAPATPDVSSDAAPPGVGDAPAASNLSTALDATSGTPGNTVLNDLVNTAPGADRGRTIAGDAQQIAPTPPGLDSAPIPDAATSHMH